MPVVHTYCSARISPEAREALKSAYGSAIEAIPGKSEAWLMCLFEDDAHIYFAGDDFRALRLRRGGRLCPQRCRRARGRPSPRGSRP